jgi:hypothetical protein
MDSNIEDRRDSDGNLLLGEPHFEEEATLLSAQPVVPLERVASERRLSRRMSFGIAIISSLALGALAAKLIYRSGGNEQPAAVVSEAARDNAGLASGPTPAPIAEARGGSTEVLQRATDVDGQSKPRTLVRQEPKEVKPRKLLPLPRAEREARRNQEFENDQKATRERRKEARRHQSRTADGLSRIREIFEGPARP